MAPTLTLEPAPAYGLRSLDGAFPNHYGSALIALPGSTVETRREFYEEIPSTQDRAIALARDGASDGSVVVARRQLQGRGRGERPWVSPAGGLYLSIVLRPVTAAGPLPLAIGSELAEALACSYGVRTRLKWPNDLLSIDRAGRRRKLAGILVDLVADALGSATAVAGIGVNARNTTADFPPELRPTSVALEELTLCEVGLDALERTVVRAVVAARRAVAEAAGARATLVRCRGLLYGVGEPVSIDGRPVGRMVGVRDDGALEVTGPEGLQAFLAGDVRVGVGA